MGSDGRNALYFIRGRQARDGIKSMDIYTTVLQDDGTWSKPEQMGATVNTPFQEAAPRYIPMAGRSTSAVMAIPEVWIST